VAVVGGGPAGMMAAIAAGELGASVCLLEPNERLGKKLNITGKGRCNLTNNCGRDEFLRSVPRNGKFLYSAYAQFDSAGLMAFFENLGVPLKTERGNRVFPASDRAFDVSAALERRLRQLNVRVVRDRAEALLLREGALEGVRGQREAYLAGRVVVATASDRESAAVADREAQAVRVVFCCTIPRPRRSGPGASWYRTDGPFYP